MDIKDLLNNRQQLANELASEFCVINGAFIPLSEVEKMGYDEFSLRSKINMPLKLYKYFPNKETKNEKEELVNYSLQALKNNTVYMQSPSKFDDVYDSDVNIDYYEYHKYRLIEYCRRCGIDVDKDKSIEEIGTVFLQAILQSYDKHKDFNHIFTIEPCTETERLSNEVFQNRVIVGLSETPDISVVVSNIISQEFQEYVKELQDTFRVSCFATNPFSQLMWGGAYADCHNGFCVEYTVLPEDKKYQEIFLNLFPMIYCKNRPDMTRRLVNCKDNIKSKDYLWDIYFHGVLRKSIDWSFQNEWRLIMPLKEKNDDKYNIDFFPITKVFLGNRMKKEKRKEIIDFCNSKHIPYVGVKRNSNTFEMQACEMKCEECQKYRNTK